MPQAVYSGLLSYADDSGLTFQPKDVHTIEDQLNKDFVYLCEWFVDNKFSIHLGEGKTKWILFGSKLKLKNAGKLNIMYNGIEIKQYSKVTYLGCLLDKTMPGESMVSGKLRSCMLLSCHIRISKWKFTPQFPDVSERIPRNRRDIWSLIEYRIYR